MVGYAKQIEARVGMVSFLNTAPIYETWRRTVKEPTWLLREAPPTVLNHLLYRGELDLAMVSSQEYALHPESYRVLADLSIAATGAVGSVFLFARRPLEELDRALVLLSSRSQTSVSLVKIILEDFYRLQPRYEIADVVSDEEGAGEAVLSIGDEALFLAASGNYPHRYDLADIWYGQTGLPFVFALWAVREEFYRDRPEVVRAIHGELKRCLREGLNDLPAICRRAAPRIPMTEEECHRYLAGMQYDFSPAQQAGLSLFFQLLIERGEVPATALPLKIIYYE
ncbi:menaquinone biosynthetic enzyme MqnA/MqnD family protein [Desulfurivibrio alkaliphilus]|uniref:Chorismate dehydratase n=1 Tax=Desulfurivibrio alkaliphilus (strain DSM 19089 / UNIQEM U267 / AHT2) TaxID=589865 RepID=D6Z0P6_DESAT|nr:menaquinone biosynthesis protein [Desulfurivibrio alkaliphilus]ADH85275.1 protein of unknown function DUF178 [Desulfurivibrio alkaliphilus AHT 2]